MDNLSKMAMAARVMGMSYGKYMALYHPASPIPVRRRKKQKQEPEAQKGQEKHCRYCRGPMPPKSGNRQYCCDDCRDKAKKRYQKEYREMTVGGKK